MIVGLGTDIIDNRRIENTIIKFGLKFKKRCFLNNEILRSNKKLKKINCTLQINNLLCRNSILNQYIEFFNREL